jgi:hypothetical protein
MSTRRSEMSDELYRKLKKAREERLLSIEKLASITKKLKNNEDVPLDDLAAYREYTIHVSFELREKAYEACPGQGLGHPEFDRYYTQLFRELKEEELEAMIVSHNCYVHVRRPQTIAIIEDAYMNRIILDD